MMYGLPAGYADLTARQTITLLSVDMFSLVTVGVLLLWYQMHRIGKLKKEPAVYIPARLRIEFVQVAPEVAADSYRDDTGQQAEAKA